MRIANPIYDAVFKYLLDDNKLATLLLSTILDEEIVELAFKPQEHISKLTSDTRLFTVYRLDFAATIKKANGEYKKILIEIQKAKLVTDIMRFRRYLGNQYRDANNIIINEQGEKVALPLLTIYFLGHSLDYSTAPVIRVQRKSYDITTGQKLDNTESFIEALTHDSYVIQIPQLHQPYKTEVEQMLQIFNQNNVVDDKHSVEINELDVPERYRPIIRRLQKAIVEPEIADAMEAEDDILEELQNMERQVEQAEKQAEQAKQEAVQSKQEAEKSKQEAEKAKEEAEKQRVEKERLQALLKQAGIQFEDK